MIYTLIGTSKLNDGNRQAWLRKLFDRIAVMPQTVFFSSLCVGSCPTSPSRVVLAIQ